MDTTKSYVMIDPDCAHLVNRLQRLFLEDSTLIPCSATPVERSSYLQITPDDYGFVGSLRLPHAVVLLIIDRDEDTPQGLENLLVSFLSDS